MAEDLRHRYADAVSGVVNEWATRPGDEGQFVGRLVAAVMAVRDEELERLQGVIDRHDHGIMPVCEGYMASKAQQAERERDGWRERAETVRMMARQWAELAAPGDARAERMDLAIADCGRAVLAALDDSQETDRGR